VAEAPSTILDQLMFDSLAFAMQQLRQREQRLVSRHPVCVHVLPLTFRNHLFGYLSRPEHFGFTCFLLWQR
jgi:hypothetical protein